MIVRVMVDKKLLADFRRAAIKAYPLELMNTLWGRLEADSIIIHKFRSVEQSAKPDAVEAYVSDMVTPAMSTQDRYLGSFHSHPDCPDPSPSEEDWNNAFECGELVFGIMSLERGGNGRFRTKTRFWPPMPEIQIIHPSIRKPSWKKTETQTSCPLEQVSAATPNPD